MRIAVINEISASQRNPAIIAALRDLPVEIFNIGMTGSEDQPQLTYIQTGIMAALALNSGAADLVIGGCGTGQGFLNSAMQYPGVFCGLVVDPLDAWLFNRINNGNCLSLALNKGFGWAGEENLKFVFEKVLENGAGTGFPVSRAESQASSRNILKEISAASHRPLAEILPLLANEVIEPVRSSEIFSGFIQDQAHNGPLKDYILSWKSNIIK